MSEVKCRFCGGDVQIVETWGTSKWIVFLLGLVGSPFCIGIPICIFALFMANEKQVKCPVCGKQ